MHFKYQKGNFLELQINLLINAAILSTQAQPEYIIWAYGTASPGSGVCLTQASSRNLQNKNSVYSIYFHFRVSL